MNDWHKIIGKIDISKWIVTKFYHYTSIPQDIFGEYDTAWHSTPVGDPYIKELFDHYLSICDVYYKDYKLSDTVTLMDNKVTIEITNIETGEHLYIGSKDWRYLIGKSYWSEFGTHTKFGVIDYYKK